MLESSEQDSETVANTDQKPVCKMDYLVKMSSGNKEFIREVIKLSQRLFPIELNKLGQAITEDNLVEVKLIAHKIRSSAAMLGAESMVTRLKRIEMLAVSNQDCTEIIELHLELSAIFKKANKELTMFLPNY